MTFSSLDNCSGTCTGYVSFGNAEECPTAERYPAETCPLPVDALAKCLATIALGDVNAMQQFYRATISLVLARARAIVAREDAEEIANDVYVYVWRHSLEYDFTRGSVQAWLSIMTRNRAIDRLRQRRFMVSLDDDQESSPLTILVNPEDAADVLLEQHEWARAAGIALSTLHPLRRQLLDLSFFQELSHKEIARTIGLPLGTVKSHLRRALHSLRQDSLPYA